MYQLKDIARKQWYCVKIHYGGPGEQKSTEILSEKNPTPRWLEQFSVYDNGTPRSSLMIAGHRIQEIELNRRTLTMRYGSDNKYALEFEILYLTDDVLDIMDNNRLHYIFVSDHRRR